MSNGGGNMVNRSPGQKRIVPTHWLVLAYFLLLALNVWLLWFLPTAPPIEKVSFMLAIVGIYNFALNFLSATGLFKADPSWLDEMTSPSLLDFVAGAFRLTGLAYLTLSLFIRGFPPPTLPRLRFFLLLITIPLALGMLLTAALVTAAYLVVIVPVAYIGYLLASVFLDAIENAPDDFAISSEEGLLTMKEALRDHRAQLRTLVVGLPATVVGIGAAASSVFP
jgi:hypothetical protein